MPGAPHGTDREDRREGTTGHAGAGRAPAELAERQIIERAQRGEVSAFNLLVERYQTLAYGLALRMVGEPEAAADVTQDAFFAAYRNIGSYRGSTFRSWLLRIVANGCYDYFRARKRRPSTSLEALRESGESSDEGANDAALGEAGADSTWDPDRVALRRETISSIETALRELPIEQRLAVTLSDIQGLDYEEVARVMGIPLGTVKSRIARARDRLRHLLTPRGELSVSADRLKTETLSDHQRRPKEQA
jgi:RNA polymerase sigma-70 factor (ECF subfamily)